MIECIDATVRYGGVEALTAVSFDVADGEFVVLAGANGAGKSTLIKLLLGIAPLSSGEVRFEGKQVGHLPTQRRVRMGLGLVPEGRDLFAGMTVIENLTLGAYQHLGRWPRASTQDLTRVFELFPRLGKRLGQTTGTLSGGEQQMLALARALMGRPRVLMCDEPSTGLAPLLVVEIFGALRHLCDAGMTIVLAEQNVSAALEIADRAFVLENGEVAMQGPAKEVLGNPAIVRAYLGEAPTKPGTTGQRKET